jgi:hypothetical protein
MSGRSLAIVAAFARYARVLVITGEVVYVIRLRRHPVVETSVDRAIGSRSMIL